MRSSFLAFLLVLFGLNLQAHNYEISLADYKLKQPIRNIKIKEIIDLRYDQTNIGWVQTGMGNKKRNADFENNFIDALHNFISDNTRFTGEEIPVILKVNKFIISEKTETSREYAYADIALEVIAKKDSGYIKIAEATSFVQASSGLDVTDKHSENIVKALDECFGKLAAVDVFERFRAAEIKGADYLNVNSYYQISQFNLPILKDHSLKKGIYNSFSEFINNAPGSTEGPKLSMEEALELLKLGNKLDGLWGFSDGKTAYVLFMDSYFPLTKRDDYFSFTAFLPTVNTNAIVAGSVVGGLAGGLVAHALTADHEEVEFAVNMITGKPVRLPDYNPQVDIYKAAKIFVYRKASKQARENLSLFVNDSLYAEISPLTYKELNFKFPVSEVKICINGAEQQCLKITPSTGDAKYLECSFKKKPGSKPEIFEMPEKEAKYYLKIIKQYREKPKK